MAAKKKNRTKHPTASTPPATARSPKAVRWAILGVLILVVAFAVYRIAAPRGRAPVSATESASTTAGAPPDFTGPRTEGTAELTNARQTIAVNVTTVYAPNVIHLKAGVPADITFSGGQGCTRVVHSRQLGFQEDITAGPRTVHIATPHTGTYSFSCGMDMVFGEVVVD